MKDRRRNAVCLTRPTWAGVLCVVCALLAARAVDAKSDSSPEARFAAAGELYRAGQFDKAAAMWREVTEEALKDDPALGVRAAIGLSTACLKAGLYQEAEQALERVRRAASRSDAGVQARYFQQTGNVRVAVHRHALSIDAFAEALTKARATGDSALIASVLNDYGNALAVGGYTSDALSAYSQALAIVRERTADELKPGLLLNIARLRLQRSERTEALDALSEAATGMSSLSPSYEGSMTSLGIVEMEYQLRSPEADRVQSRLDALSKVQAYAADSGSARLRSLAYGYESRERAGLSEYSLAIELARKAMFFAAQGQAPDLAYQWQWQLASLFRKQEKLEESIDAFAKSIATLTPIRQELLNGYHDSYAYFQRSIRPVYIDYVDALLIRADRTADPRLQRELLERARVVLETLKSSELQDYFRDECVVAQESKSIELSQIGAKTAVLYPISLPDRIELLLSIGGEFHRRSVPVEQNQLIENAKRFREYVQVPGNSQFLPYANRLYRWLIEPIKPELTAAGIDTLVVISDGVLRTVPFAALHSGERYLIEEMAVAVTPSLKLTAAPQSQPTRASALLAGVAQSVQGFAPLPQVETELATIHDQVGGKLLSNREYTKKNLREALADSNFNIVHMATHGVVGATPAESFLLTYDGKLTMSDLDYLLRIGEFRDRPIELLTLSACETAVGDERAALGLAGIAVKSGAQSVVASLWLVDDAATAQLMNRFYRNLNLRGGGPASKAKALRAAKLNMLAEPATSHPANWAAFMLIGNWQ